MHELRAVRRIHYQTWQRYFETVQFIIQTKIEFVKQNILVAIFCNILFTVNLFLFYYNIIYFKMSKIMHRLMFHQNEITTELVNDMLCNILGASLHIYHINVYIMR